jgi:hypothetical protein
MTSSQKEMSRAAVNFSSARLTSTNNKQNEGVRDSMATKKKEVKVRDLKPSKDAKGGAARNTNTQRGSQNRGSGRTDTGRRVFN